MSALQPGREVLGDGTRWIVRVTLGTVFPPAERGIEAMSNLADPRGITVASRGPLIDEKRADAGIVFTAEVPADQVNQVPGWAFAIAEEACGYGVVMDVALVDLRVCTPEVYEAEVLQPDRASRETI